MHHTKILGKLHFACPPPYQLRARHPRGAIFAQTKATKLFRPSKSVLIKQAIKLLIVTTRLANLSFCSMLIRALKTRIKPPGK